MELGRVIGTIWATRKYDSLKSYKLLWLEPLNAEKKVIGKPFVAVDTIGAGTDEIVYYVTASEAVIPMDVDMAPTDASIVGIVDSIYSIDD